MTWSGSQNEVPEDVINGDEGGGVTDLGGVGNGKDGVVDRDRFAPYAPWPFLL